MTERNLRPEDPDALAIVEQYAAVVGRFLFEFLRLENSIEIVITASYEVDDQALVRELGDALFRGRTAKPKVDMLWRIFKESENVDHSAFAELVRECRALIEIRNDLAHRLPRISLSGGNAGELFFDEIPGKASRQLDDVVAKTQRMPALTHELLTAVAGELAWRRHQRQTRSHRELDEVLRHSADADNRGE